MPSAFDSYLTDGTLHVSREGDLWRSIPRADEDAAAVWSWHGPVASVYPSELPAKYAAALARLQRRWADRPREDLRAEDAYSFRLGLRR